MKGVLRQSSQFLTITFIWVVFLLICTITSLHTGRTVSLNYYEAAWHWLSQQPLYTLSGGGFLYAPQSAIMYVPLAVMPFWLSEILWRIVIFIPALYATIQWSRLFDSSNPNWPFFLLSIVLLPVSYSAFQLGQMNAVVAIIGLLTMLAIYHHAYTAAAFTVVLGVFLKPTIAPYYLLLLALYAPMRRPMILFTGAFLAVPFLTTLHWQYATEQCIAFLYSLQSTTNTHNYATSDYAQFYNLFYIITGIDFTAEAQRLTRMLMAAISLLSCLYIKRRSQDTRTIVWTIYSIFAGYLMLFGPATENNGYLILSAAIAGFCVLNVLYSRFKTLVFLIAVNFGIIFAGKISVWYTPGNDHWFTPLMALVFYIYTTVFCFVQPHTAARAQVTAENTSGGTK